MAVLNRNYRSTSSIVARAEGLIRHNEHHMPNGGFREKGNEVL
ncbi:MAG: hypothetical protein ACLSFZ_12635 [Frisingicoccus sp.]